MPTLARTSGKTRHGMIRRMLIVIASAGLVTMIAGCGGGLEVTTVIGVSPPPISALAIQLTQIGPATVRVDWSDDPDVYVFEVERNGYVLANVMATTFVDFSVAPTGQYCYQVFGYSLRGDLLAATDSACILIAP